MVFKKKKKEDNTAVEQEETKTIKNKEDNKEEDGTLSEEDRVFISEAYEAREYVNPSRAALHHARLLSFIAEDMRKMREALERIEKQE